MKIKDEDFLTYDQKNFHLAHAHARGYENIDHVIPANVNQKRGQLKKETSL